MAESKGTKGASKAALVRFRQASIGYGDDPVLHDVDFSIDRGSFLGILGFNGSGKTTILRTVLGLIPCVQGQLQFPSTGEETPRFGYVPQKERLDPIYPLTAYDVAAMGTYRKLEMFQRWRGIDHRSLIEHCLSVCGAHELSPRRFSDLSGGQKQRVLIARALAAQPQLLLLDEPLAGLDIETQRSLLQLFEKLKRDRELTILMVSHRVRAERDLFTHVAWVDRGQVIFGPSEEMLGGGRVGEVFRSEL